MCASKSQTQPLLFSLLQYISEVSGPVENISYDILWGNVVYHLSVVGVASGFGDLSVLQKHRFTGSKTGFHKLTTGYYSYGVDS